MLSVVCIKIRVVIEKGRMTQNLRRVDLMGRVHCHRIILFAAREDPLATPLSLSTDHTLTLGHKCLDASSIN